MAFKYSKSKLKTGKAPEPKFVKQAKDDSVEEEKTIQGRPAGSTEEWYVSRALEALGYDYSYQVPMFGGNVVRGGTIVDFLVNTAPMYTVIRVMGEYWHSGRQSVEDELLREKIRKYFGDRVIIIDAPSKSLPDIDTTKSYLKQEMRI